MSAPLLTLDGLRARFARDPEGVIDFADDIAARFANFRGAYIPAPLKEAALDLLARCPEPSDLPLWGVPYVVAANVDVVGLPTSIGVPALDFQPDFDAVVIGRLKAAGALLVGKVPVDPVDREIAAAGAAASVASGLAAFGIVSTCCAATAAADHRVVAIEPTRDLLLTEGLFAIAPELDGIAIFSTDIASGVMLHGAIENTRHVDESRSKPLERLGFLGGDEPAAADLANQLGLAAVIVDDGPFVDLAALMEDEVWLVTRLNDVAVILAELPELFPSSLRGRLSRVFGMPAAAQIRAQRRLENLRRQIEASFTRFDLLFVPPRNNGTGFISACGLAAIILPDGGALVGHAGADSQIGFLAHAISTANRRASTRPIDILSSSPLAQP